MDRNPSTLKFPASLYMYCVRCTRYQVGLPLWQEIQPVKTCTYKRCRSFSHVVLLLAVHNQRWGGGVNPCPTPTKGVQLSFQAASSLHTTLKIMEYSSESVPYNWLYIIHTTPYIACTVLYMIRSIYRACAVLYHIVLSLREVPLPGIVQCHRAVLRCPTQIPSGLSQKPGGCPSKCGMNSTAYTT